MECDITEQHALKISNADCDRVQQFSCQIYLLTYQIWNMYELKECG